MTSNKLHKVFFTTLKNCIAATLLFTLLLSSCSSPNQQIPDVSGIKITLQTYRFDKDLYAVDSNQIGSGLQQLSVKYPDFLNFYLDTIQAFGIHGNYTDTSKAIQEGLKVFLTYKDYVELEDTILKHYPDTKDVDAELTQGFQFMKYYFPAYHVPRVMYVSLGLKNLPAFTIDTAILGISLDMFLGEQYPYYRSVGIFDYQAPHLRKSYIPVDAFRVVYTHDHPVVTDDRTLIDLMIQKGKEQYFLHKVLPNTPDSVLFGFSQPQVEWCNENEALIYNFFIRNCLLYNKDAQSVMPYVNDGPFTPGIPASGKIKTTPGNLGTWLGYRIVCAYVSQHPKMTLAALCGNNIDPAKFLDEARYRPK